MVNIFKTFEYDINLNPTQVIGRIKSKTLFSNRISGSTDEFEGEFHGNRFKIHFSLPGNIWVMSGINPEFYGLVTDNKFFTKLNIKMRIHPLISLLLTMPAIMFIIGVIAYIYSDETTLLILTSIALISCTAIFGGMLNNKYNDMKIVLEELFKDELM